jgi:hypothetical protein
MCGAWMTCETLSSFNQAPPIDRCFSWWKGHVDNDRWMRDRHFWDDFGKRKAQVGTAQRRMNVRC